MTAESRNVEGIRAFRDHHGNNPKSPVHAWWRDVNTLLNAYDELRDRVVGEQGATQDAFEYGYRRAADLRAERDVLASIVRDLAANSACAEGECGGSWCWLCGDGPGWATEPEGPEHHDPTCAWRRAREWVQAQEASG